MHGGPTGACDRKPTCTGASVWSRNSRTKSQRTPSVELWNAHASPSRLTRIHTASSSTGVEFTSSDQVLVTTLTTIACPCGDCSKQSFAQWSPSTQSAMAPASKVLRSLTTAMRADSVNRSGAANASAVAPSSCGPPWELLLQSTCAAEVIVSAPASAS